MKYQQHVHWNLSVTLVQQSCGCKRGHCSCYHFDLKTLSHTHNCSTALWILSVTTRVSQYQKKHSPTHTHCGHQISLSASFIYYDPWHPPYSIHTLYSLFPQTLSKFSLVYLLAWHPPLHTPYISSSNHYLRWVWVGECFFWYRLTRVVPDKIQRAVNGCVCVCVFLKKTEIALVVIASNNLSTSAGTSQCIGDVGMIKMHGNKMTNVPPLFPVILHYWINLHLVPTHSK